VVWFSGGLGDAYRAEKEARRAKRTYPSYSSPSPKPSAAAKDARLKSSEKEGKRVDEAEGKKAGEKLGRVEYARFHLKPGESTEWCHVPPRGEGLSWEWRGEEPLTDRVHLFGDSMESPEMNVPAGRNDPEANLVQHVRFTNPHNSPVTGIVYVLVPGGKDTGHRVTLDNAPR
jgi:hypothetical protein